MDPKILRLTFQGAPTTIAVIRKAALQSQNFYNVRQLAERITEHLQGKDYLSEYLAVYYFVLKNTRYMRDPRTVELVRAPYEIVDQLQRGKTPQIDCEEMAALIAALLLATGSKVRFVTVAFADLFHQGERQYTHVFAQAQEPRTKVWVTLDPVAGPETHSMLARVKAAKIWQVA